jgi:protein involved in polysaccharide export with SLBB domain
MLNLSMTHKRHPGTTSHKISSHLRHSFALVLVFAFLSELGLSAQQLGSESRSDRNSRVADDSWQSEPRLRTRRLPQSEESSPQIDGAEGENAYGSEESGTADRTLPATRIISILRQDSELLASAKSMLAQELSVDPSTITDESLYSVIRQDASLRTQITQELSTRGYDVSAEFKRESDDSSIELSGTRERYRNEDGARERYRTEDGARDRYRNEDGARDRYRNEDLADTARTQNRTSRADSADNARQDIGQDLNQPATRRRVNPYRSIPSLKDLYSQIPASTERLKRFGSDTFRLGTGNADKLPTDLPVGPDYVLGSGDNLVVSIWGLPHLDSFSVPQRLTRPVDRQGQIALPDVGTITVVGQTIAEARNTIQRALETQYKGVKVDVSLGRVRTVRVYVVGDVQRPGAYDVSSLSTPLNALYAAGGPTSRGSLRVLRQVRGKDLVKEIDLYDFLLHGVRSDVERLLPGDTIQVPPIGPQVSVSGMVRRPAIYELKGDQSLKDVLDLAGGVLVSATLRQINVERIEAHQRRTMLSIQIPENGDDQESTQRLSAFHIQDGDSVRVSPILPYSEKSVYLDGHVFRPGKYAYREGMRVSDLLHSYQDVMPEPAAHAEIIRLQAPDFRPTTIEFELPNVLNGDDPILLQPFDVVRVFSRYEIDSPKVSIKGEVLRPGVYPLANGMTVSGLINMAGGFRRSAYRESADVSSYVVQNGSRILNKVTTVDLGKAMEGDKAADVALKPGDVVGIRQLTGWNDIGASIKISGEVAYPGTYGIAAGERLSAVLKRAGGLRSSAFPEGAVLERVQVREVGEKTRQDLIRRLETTNPNIAGGMSTGQEQLALVQAAQTQQQQTLAALRSHTASGRMVIRISSDISRWENTAVDIELRAGDLLMIPKRPSFVLVSGQVRNPTALSYVPGKTAGWYLKLAGGPNEGAEKKGIFVLRADGTVVGAGSNWISGGALSVRLKPGDSIIVPEKVVGGSIFWKNMMTTAQVLSGIATTAALAAAAM